MTLLWAGPSQFDPAVRIMVIATDGSVNTKTGPMTQVWILGVDKHPHFAVREGADQAICGSCAFRGDRANGIGRSCYVNTAFAPASIYRAYRAGQYRDLSVFDGFMWQDMIRRYGSAKAIRIGAYGDPAAVPVALWAHLTSRAAMWTGYTHHWRQAHAELKHYCMASVDSVQEMREAKQQGWRTYRVYSEDFARDVDPGSANEVTCPASAESGHATTCLKCGLCNGRSGRRQHDVRIYLHGSKPGGFYRAQQNRLEFE